MTVQNENPFVGLRPFQTEESLLFFGRHDQILELLQKLHEHHFVAIIGSSGSGKSSLIKAGLIPRLKAGYLVNQRDQWLVAVMKPGQTPLYNLALSIYSALGFNDEHDEIQSLVTKIKDEGADALVDLLQHLWQKQNTSVFILVDQFEELFRFSSEKENKDESIDFVNILLDISNRNELPIYTAITMRSDFIGDCDQFYGLPEALNKSQYLVPRLNRVQLKAAIEGPVKLYGGKINPALTSKLLNEVQSTKDELPLLQHLLMRIWDYEEKTDHSAEMDLKDFDQVGGIAKALSNHAEEALLGMPENKLKASKKIFQALTAVDENGRKIRRPAKLSELVAITQLSREEVLNIIQQFNDDKRSFIVLNPIHGQDDILVDISHESLIRQWERLSGWVDEETEARKAYLQLADSALLYKKNKKDLLGGSELQMAALWFNEFKPEAHWAARYDSNFDDNINYLTASIDESRKQAQNIKIQKRRKYILYAVSLLLIFGTTAFIYRQRQERILAQKNQLEKEKKQREDSTEQAKDRQREKRAKEDTLRLLKSIQEKDSTYKFELKKINDAYKYVQVAKELSAYDPTMAMRLAELSMKKVPDTLVKYFVLNLMKEFGYYRTLSIGYKNIPRESINSFCSSDGKIYFTATKKGVFNTENNKRITYIPGYLRADGEFSSDNKFIVLASNEPEDGKSAIEVIKLDDGSVVKTFNDTSNIIAARFASDDAGAIIIQNKAGELKLWNTETGKILLIDSNVNLFSLNIKANEIVSSKQDGTISFWKLNTGEKLRETVKSIYQNSLSYSKENNLIAINSDETITIMDNNGNDILEIQHPTNQEYFNNVYFLPSNQLDPDGVYYSNLAVSFYSGNLMVYSISLDGKKGKVISSKSYLGNSSIYAANPKGVNSIGINNDNLCTTSNYDGVKLWGYCEGESEQKIEQITALLKSEKLDHLPNGFDEQKYLNKFIEGAKNSMRHSKRK